MKTWIAGLLLLLLTGLGGARAAEVYRGTLGASEVVLVLDGGQDRVGSYFYRRFGDDISLWGRPVGNAFELQERTLESAGDGDTAGRVTGLWRLRRTPDGLVGDWRSGPSSAALPVQLSRLPPQPPRPFLPSSTFLEYLVDTYGQPAGDRSDMMPYYLERARLGPILGPERRAGVGAYRMVTDRRTGVSWPQLTRHPDARAMALINDVFEQNRALAIAEAQDCRTSLVDMGHVRPGERPRIDVATITITRLGRRLISLTAGGSIYCGGAHPANFYRSFTYDTPTATLFDIATLLDLGTPERQAAFSRFWRARMAERMRRHPGVILEECEAVADPDTTSDSLDFRLTPRGLMIVEADSSGAGAACNQDLVELSMAELTPFLVHGAAAYWD